MTQMNSLSSLKATNIHRRDRLTWWKPIVSTLWRLPWAHNTLSWQSLNALLKIKVPNEAFAAMPWEKPF